MYPSLQLPHCHAPRVPYAALRPPSNLMTRRPSCQSCSSCASCSSCPYPQRSIRCIAVAAMKFTAPHLSNHVAFQRNRPECIKPSPHSTHPQSQRRVQVFVRVHVESRRQRAQRPFQHSILALPRGTQAHRRQGQACSRLARPTSHTAAMYCQCQETRARMAQKEGCVRVVSALESK